jgi:ABC-type multidrug transport system permease subunit
MLLLLLAGWLIFGVPVRGSWLVLALVIVAGGAAFAGLGLLLAARTEHTETVSGLINLIMVPMWMFSGTFFTTQRFPDAFQPVIRALPLTSLNEALRGVMLQEASLDEVTVRLIILGGWAVASFCLALWWFRWR